MYSVHVIYFCAVTCTKAHWQICFHCRIVQSSCRLLSSSMSLHFMN